MRYSRVDLKGRSCYWYLQQVPVTSIPRTSVPVSLVRRFGDIKRELDRTSEFRFVRRSLVLLDLPMASARGAPFRSCRRLAWPSQTFAIRYSGLDAGIQYDFPCVRLALVMIISFACHNSFVTFLHHLPVSIFNLLRNILLMSLAVRPALHYRLFITLHTTRCTSLLLVPTP